MKYNIVQGYKLTVCKIIGSLFLSENKIGIDCFVFICIYVCYTIYYLHQINTNNNCYNKFKNFILLDIILTAN